MDGALIPWWMAVLLGIGAAGLGVWQFPGISRPVRLGGGLLGLVYLLLMAYVLCSESRSGAEARWTQLRMIQAGLGVVSIGAAAILTGSPSDPGRRFWFGIVSLANAGIALSCRSATIAAMLGLTGLVCLGLAAAAWRNGTLTSQDLFPGERQCEGARTRVYAGLAMVTGFTMALALLATGRYAWQVETTRPTTTRRLSRFPERDRVRGVLSIDPDRESPTTLFAGLGQRGDLILLMGGLLGLTLLARAPRSKSGNLATDTPTTDGADSQDS